MIITTLTEIWRHTFPKNLRWCRQCQILYAQLAAVDKRYKDRKYIPRSELANVIDSYVDGPPIFFMKWPIFRQIFLIRGINSIRVIRGYPAWLFTGAIRKEHAKITRWFDAHGNSLWIKRDKFKHEVLDNFIVVQQYHKFFALGCSFVGLLLCILIAGALSEPLYFWYMYYIRGFQDREEVAEKMAAILQQHAKTEVTEDYKEILPPAAFTRKHHPAAAEQKGDNKKPSSPAAAVDDRIYFNIIEMTSPDNLCRVVFVPMPKVGPVSFYEKVGSVIKSCSALVLEEVPLNSLHKIPPAYFFFLEGRANFMFPSLNLHHRIYDILSKDTETSTPPPKLLPGSARPPWWVRYILGITPLSVKSLYSPYFLTGTKQDAKVAWGTMKAVIKGEGFFPSNIENQLERIEEMREKAAPNDAAGLNQMNKGIAKREIFSPDQLALKRSIAEKEEEKQQNAKKVAKATALKEKNEKAKKAKELGESMETLTEASEIVTGAKKKDDINDQTRRGGETITLPSYDPQSAPNIVASRPNLVSESVPGSSLYHAQRLTAERRVYPSICVPWTVSQITNLESSFYRAGWRVTNIASVEWLSPHETGRTYFDYYHDGTYREMDWNSGSGTGSLFGKIFGRTPKDQQAQQQQPPVQQVTPAATAAKA